MIHVAARLFGRRPPRTAPELHQQFAFDMARARGDPAWETGTRAAEAQIKRRRSTVSQARSGMDGKIILLEWWNGGWLSGRHGVRHFAPDDLHTKQESVSREH